MSKPYDIPDDVWAAAAVAVGLAYYDQRQMLIARAILAERERCAKVAEDLRVGRSPTGYSGGFNDACNAIANAIRHPREPT